MHKVEQLFSNQFAAIDNANEDGGTKSGQNLQLVASHFAENMDQNSSSTPAIVKNNILLSAHASKDMVPFVAEQIGNKAQTSNAPTLQFSSLHIEEIIKEAQNSGQLLRWAEQSEGNEEGNRGIADDISTDCDAQVWAASEVNVNKAGKQHHKSVPKQSVQQVNNRAAISVNERHEATPTTRHQQLIENNQRSVMQAPKDGQQQQKPTAPVFSLDVESMDNYPTINKNNTTPTNAHQFNTTTSTTTTGKKKKVQQKQIVAAAVHCEQFNEDINKDSIPPGHQIMKNSAGEKENELYAGRDKQHYYSASNNVRMGKQLVDRDATSNNRQPKSPGSIKEQQKSKSTLTRSVSSRQNASPHVMKQQHLSSTSSAKHQRNRNQTSSTLGRCAENGNESARMNNEENL